MMATTSIGAPNSLARNLAVNPQKAAEIAIELYQALWVVNQRRMNAAKSNYTWDDIEREQKQIEKALANAVR